MVARCVNNNGSVPSTPQGDYRSLAGKIGTCAARWQLIFRARSKRTALQREFGGDVTDKYASDKYANRNGDQYARIFTNLHRLTKRSEFQCAFSTMQARTLLTSPDSSA